MIVHARYQLAFPFMRLHLVFCDIFILLFIYLFIQTLTQSLTIIIILKQLFPYYLFIQSALFFEVEYFSSIFICE